MGVFSSSKTISTKLISCVLAIFGVSGCALSVISCAYGGSPVDMSAAIIESGDFEESPAFDSESQESQN